MAFAHGSTVAISSKLAEPETFSRFFSLTAIYWAIAPSHREP
jgi:hypothetical protein